MNLKELLRVIKDRDFTFSFLGLLFLITPGVATIFYFSQNIFLQIDFLTLILCGITLIAPIILINFLLCLEVVIDVNKEDGTETHFRALFLSILASASFVYSSLLLAFLYQKGFKFFLLEVIILEFGLFLLVYLLKKKLL
jgi:hypothetical protein